ncbi:MAG TPA: sugar phosphate isomerase/epimerase [Pirellulales bacterium]|jgi:4-hydroxyphenylpyruvate dioxygenase|nr:sugar phosphate isomerase/epimerase [Pirellulales bacterium]
MIPALSQVCSLNSPFEVDIDEYAAGACHTVELWLGKLETYLEKNTVDDVRRLFEKYEVLAPVASFQGGLLTSQGDARRVHWEHFGRRLDLCQSLGVQTIVVAGDIVVPLDEQAVERVRVSLTQAADSAAERGLRVALEFQASARLANNLQTAAALVAECARPALGLCLDVFHWYVGPSKTEDLAYLSTENLFHVQFSDLAGVARELASDGDRILPGDGDLPLTSIVDALRQIGYEGVISVELMNPQMWQIPAIRFGEIAMTSLRKVLGMASME